MSTLVDIVGKDYSATPTEATIRGLLGGMVISDWRQALIARGLGWHFDAGAFSTPIVGGGAGTIFDQDQPEIFISVPSGYALIPTRISITCQPPLTGTDSDEIEILIAVDRVLEAGGFSGGGTAETPTNMRTNISSGCPLTCYSAMTVNMTLPTLGVELAHVVKIAEFGSDIGRIWTDLALLYEPRRPHIIVGPAALYCYWGGTVAMSGFANIDFIAITSPLLTTQT